MITKFPYILIIGAFLLFSCASKTETKVEPLHSFEPDSIKIVQLFSSAATAENFKTFLDSAEDVVQQSKLPEQCQDLFLAQKGAFFLRRGELDSAAHIAQLGLELSTDFSEKSKGKFYNIEGHVFSFKKDYSSAIAAFKKSLAIFEKYNDSLNVAYINNNIANIFFSLVDYNSAYKHAKASYDIIQKYPDSPYYSSIISVLATSEAFIEKTNEAKKHAHRALELTQGTPNIVPYSLSLYALGDIAVSEDSLEVAYNYYQESLGLCEKYGLAQYTLINKAALLNTCVKLEKFNEAISYGEEALVLSNEIQNENIQLSLHKNLARAYGGIHKDRRAFEHMDIAFKLKEEASSKESKSIIHDLLIQYESEKKDKEISENKIKILEDKATIQRNQFFIVLLIIGIIILFAAVTLFIRNRKQQLSRIEKEKETEVIKASLIGENKERMRLSRELHDGIASELLGIRIKAQQLEMESSWVSTLDQVHQEIRRISHNLAPYKVEQFGLIEAMKLFCLENNSTKNTIHFFCNGNKEIPQITSQAIYRIGQELIQNAIKHSQASNIDVQLFLDDTIRLSVEDDGIGMSQESLNRLIEKLNLQWQSSKLITNIFADSTVNSGTSITIEFK